MRAFNLEVQESTAAMLDIPSAEQLSELESLCEAWLRGRETVPNCELINEERMAYLAGMLLRDRRRLLKWIERTATDTAGGTKCGYHARRIRLEAAQILNGASVLT